MMVPNQTMPYFWRDLCNPLTHIHVKWVFPQMGTPKNRWFIVFMVEDPIQMEYLEVPPFQETSKILQRCIFLRISNSCPTQLVCFQHSRCWAASVHVVHKLITFLDGQVMYILTLEEMNFRWQVSFSFGLV